jgi:hypothetical protein
VSYNVDLSGRQICILIVHIITGVSLVSATFRYFPILFNFLHQGCGRGILSASNRSIRAPHLIRYF